MNHLSWRPERQRGQAEDTDLSIRELVAALRERKLSIAACVGVCVALALAYVVAATPLYTATASLLIDSRKNPIARQTEGGGPPLDVAEVESQVAIINSERVASAVVDRLQLDKQGPDRSDPTFLERVMSFVRAAKNALKAVLVGSPKVEISAKQQAIRDLLGRLDAGRSGSAYVIDISYTSKDPEEAALIANAFAEAYVNEQLQSKADSWRRAGAWLRERLNELREQSRTAALEAQTFKSNNGLSTTSRGLINDQQLEAFTTTLLDARAKTADARSKLEQIKELLASDAPEMSVSDALNNSVIVKLRQLYTEKFTAEAEWSARYGKEHNAAQRLRQEMQSIQRAIRDELSRIRDAYQSDYAVALANEERLSEEYNRLLATAADSNIARVDARELDRIAAGYENAYNELLKQYNESVSQQSFPLTEARVLSPASVPLAASHPKRTLTVLLAAIFGLGLGAALAILRRLTDRSLRTPEQVKAAGANCVAVVPDLDIEERLTSILPFRRPARRLSEVRRARYVLDAPRSRFAERFRSLKTELTVAELRSPITCVGLTSGAPSEGKSTTASNLAFLLASSGARTLLIDADVRNPKLSRVLAPQGRVGLVDALRDFERLPQALQNGSAGLMFLPAGDLHVEDPGDLLGSKAMERLLTGARNQFDWVILDLPPVGPVSGTRMVTSLVDTMIVVAEWGKTSVEALTSTLSALEHDEDKVLGCVLNRVDFRVLSASGDYHAGHYYGPPPTTLSTQSAGSQAAGSI